jgi:integrase
MRVKLTERMLHKLLAPDPSGKQALHWDSELKGFAVLCSGVSNSRTYVVQRGLPGGKNRRVTIGAVAEISLEVARHRAADMLDQLRRGQDPKKRSAADATLHATLEAYLVARKDLRPATVRLYTTAIESYLASWCHLPLKAITPDMVEERHRSIAAAIAKTSKQKKSGKVAANVAMRVLKILWDFAVERAPELGANPVRRLKRQWYPEQRRTRMVPLDRLPEFYQAVLALDNKIVSDFMRLVLFTGLRASEALALTWNEIDFTTKVIRIPNTRNKSKRKLDLPMSDFVHSLLVARRALGNARYVFPGNASGHIATPEFQYDLIAQRTGIQISTHDMRRTFCTIAETTEISPLALKALVNHSLGKDVTAGYVQMTIERLREAAQRVADRMQQLCGIEDVTGGNVARLK